MWACDLIVAAEGTRFADVVGTSTVEQHVRQALAVADYAYVMQRGQVVLSGPAAELRDRQGEIEQWYLAAQPNDDPAERGGRSDSKTSLNTTSLNGGSAG